MKTHEIRTYPQLVRHYLPRADNRTVDFVLWNMTAFPCAPADYIRAQLADIAVFCAPVRKRGWFRKLQRRSAQIDDDIMAQLLRLPRD